MSCHMFVTGVQ